MYIWSHLLGIAVYPTLREAVTSDTCTHVSLPCHCSLLGWHLRTCGRGCLWLRPSPAFHMASDSASLGGEGNDCGPLCRCFPSPLHPATYSLGDGFPLGRKVPGSWGDTEAQFSGLTTLTIASGLVGRRCMAERATGWSLLFWLSWMSVVQWPFVFSTFCLYYMVRCVVLYVTGGSGLGWKVVEMSSALSNPPSTPNPCAPVNTKVKNAVGY